MKVFRDIWVIDSSDLMEWVSSGEGGDVLVNMNSHKKIKTESRIFRTIFNSFGD